MPIGYVGLYCRISVDKRGRREGVESQERWGREYAAQKWPGVPIKVFVDNDLSAAGDDEAPHRPGFDEFQEWLQAGRLSHVWAVEQSRLQRGEIGWFQLAAMLDAAGIVELDTRRDGIVRVRDEVAGIKAVLAAAEVRKLKRRVNDRLGEIAAEGRPSGSRRPFGYRYGVDSEGRKSLLQDPGEAEIVREMAERILSGWSMSSIAADLTTRGVTGSSGSRLKAQRIREIVTNPTVAGKLVRRGVIVGTGIWTPILDEITWLAVKRKLEGPRIVTNVSGASYRISSPTRRTRAGRKYLLTGGLAVCGLCGARMDGTIKRWRKNGVVVSEQPYMVCSVAGGGCNGTSILLKPTEEYVVSELQNALDSPAFRAALTADEHTEQREAASRALGAIEEQRDTLAAEWGAGELSDTEWKAARKKLVEREQETRAALAEIPPPVHGNLDTVREAWPEMTLDEKREFLRLIIERITIHRARPGTKSYDSGRVEITWWQ